jgi:hypothetical protein
VTDITSYQTTLFTRENCYYPARVQDLDTGLAIRQAMTVDTASGQVVCADYPLRLVRRGELATHTLHYRRIDAIYGGTDKPGLFFCYGLQGQSGGT